MRDAWTVVSLKSLKTALFYRQFQGIFRGIDKIGRFLLFLNYSTEVGYLKLNHEG